MLKELSYDVLSDPRGVAFELRHESVRHVVGDFRPGCIPRQIVGKVLSPEPEHLPAWGGQRLVGGTKRHGNQGRIGGRPPAQVFSVGGAQLPEIPAEQLQAGPRLFPRRRRVLDGGVEGEAEHNPKPVPDAKAVCAFGAVLSGQEVVERFPGVGGGADGTARVDVPADPNAPGVVSLDQMYEQVSPTAPFRFRLHIQHGSGAGGAERESVVERFRFDLRTPVTSVDPPAEIYLQAPSGGLWPDLTFEEVDDFWTRIEADGTEEVGVGTMTLSLFVDPLSLPADELGVRASVDLAEQGFGGTNYRLEADARLEPVVESD